MSEERDYVMARLSACRAHLSAATSSLDMALLHFVEPSEDVRRRVYQALWDDDRVVFYL